MSRLNLRNILKNIIFFEFLIFNGFVARINGLNKHRIKAGHDKNHQIPRISV